MLALPPTAPLSKGDPNHDDGGQCGEQDNPDEYSSVLTGVMMPDGIDADVVRKVILDNFDMSLGTGLGKLKGKIFRIGHLGEINELTLIGALSGVEMGLSLADVSHQKGGVAQAMSYLTKTVER